MLERNPHNAAAWGQLGMLIQAKDIRFHENAMEMKEEALDCFNRALEYAATVSFEIQIRHEIHVSFPLK